MKGHIRKRGGSYRVYYWQKGKRITQSFKTKQDAEIFQAGLVVMEKQGSLDYRDYRRDNPLGFANSVKRFLRSKRLLKGVKKYEQRLRFAVNEWGNRNIKQIGFEDISDLLTGLQEQGLSSKYRKDIRDTIRMLYHWLNDCDDRIAVPKFPTVQYALNYRNVVTKEQQCAIISEVEKIAPKQKIYIGIKFLSTYIKVRPSELISVKEKHIDLDMGRIYIPHPKERKGKHIPLLPEDVELLRSFPKAFPEIYFFRHNNGSKFGKDYLYTYWRKACRNLGIEGVSLYPGTRHSSAIDMRKRHSPEAVKRATGHETNQAFERYLRIEDDELRALYADLRGGTKGEPKIRHLDDYK